MKFCNKPRRLPIALNVGNIFFQGSWYSCSFNGKSALHFNIDPNSNYTFSRLHLSGAIYKFPAPQFQLKQHLSGSSTSPYHEHFCGTPYLKMATLFKLIKIGLEVCYSVLSLARAPVCYPRASTRTHGRFFYVSRNLMDSLILQTLRGCAEKFALLVRSV